MAQHRGCMAHICLHRDLQLGYQNLDLVEGVVMQLPLFLGMHYLFLLVGELLQLVLVPVSLPPSKEMYPLQSHQGSMRR